MSNHFLIRVIVIFGIHLLHHALASEDFFPDLFVGDFLLNERTLAMSKKAYSDCVDKFNYEDKFMNYTHKESMDIPSFRFGFRYMHGNPSPSRNITLWPNNEIPIELDQAVKTTKYRERLKCAVRYFYTETCIRFVNREKGHHNYLLINNEGTSCMTDAVGMKGGKQELHLGDESCWRHGIIVHELMHVIGRFHEQQRNDRDQHVHIYNENIRYADLLQFDTVKQLGFTNHVDIGSYDFSSIMHYPSKIGEDVVIGANIYKYHLQSYQYTNQMGNRKRPTKMDSIKVNTLYGCHNQIPRNIPKINPVQTTVKPNTIDNPITTSSGTPNSVRTYAVAAASLSSRRRQIYDVDAMSRLKKKYSECVDEFKDNIFHHVPGISMDSEFMDFPNRYGFRDINRPPPALKNVTLWPNNSIPIELHHSVNSSRYIKRLKCALLYFKTETCIRFVKKREEHNNYLLISKKGTRCSTDAVGMKGGMQELQLGDESCWTHGTIVHELLHVAGLFHEQQRNDRDQHIDINYENISPVDRMSFLTVKEIGYNNYNDIGSYDFSSIMHYPSKIGDNRVMVAKLSKYKNKSYFFTDQMGNRERPTEMDTYKVNTLYGCSNSVMEKPRSVESIRKKFIPTTETSSIRSWSKSQGKADVFSPMPVYHECLASMMKQIDETFLHYCYHRHQNEKLTIYCNGTTTITWGSNVIRRLRIFLKRVFETLEPLEMKDGYNFELDPYMSLHFDRGVLRYGIIEQKCNVTSFVFNTMYRWL